MGFGGWGLGRGIGVGWLWGGCRGKWRCIGRRWRLGSSGCIVGVLS
jgi:hypothetical protein